MDNAIVHKLKTMTSQFYESCAESFSATRQNAWNGWHKVCDLIAESTNENLQIIDIACGNFRFEKFIQNELGARKNVNFSCVDNCLPLSTDAPANVNFKECDIISALENGTSFTELNFVPADYLVSFGFMHHIPSEKLRLRFLEYALSCIKPGGYLIISFWQFLKNPSLARKANEKRAAALQAYKIDDSQLEDGDCFLGWQESTKLFRYCHNFTDEEVYSYIKKLPSNIKLLTSFNADGKQDDLNLYIVIQKEE